LSVAREPTPADIFGVDIGTPLPVLSAFAKASLSCREFGTPTHALACQGGLGKAAGFVPDSTTFWITDGRVSRIFELSDLGSRDYAECVDAFKRRVSQVESALGRSPVVPAEEPPWAKGMDDGIKLLQLGQGRLGLKAIWRFQRREIGVALRANKGTPVLVVGLEPSSTIACDSQSVAAMLMDLFPPAPPAVRAQAAEDLATCKVTGAAGALAAAAGTGQEKEVRVEAVRALGEIGPTGLPHLEAIARDAKQGEAAIEARAVLAKPKATVGGGRNARLAVTPVEESVPVKAPASVAAPPRIALPKAQAPVAAPVVARPAVAAVAVKPVEKPAAAVTAPVPPPHLPTAPAPAAATATTYEKIPTPASPVVESDKETPPSESSPAAESPESKEPPAPKTPPDGTVLALTTSLVAGGVWGGGLSLLAQQSSPGVLLLVGSAGAVIGGGTAWGLTHFGVRPSPSQALWFTNSTAWGTLAGLMTWAGTGSDNVKLKWGLLVGGESLGMGMGVLGARQWDWTPSQILFANSLVLGAGFAGGGGHLLAHPGEPFQVTPLIGYGTAPAMVAAGLLSRYVNVSRNDLHLLAASAVASAWSGGLLAYGLDTDPATRNDRLAGGFLAGMGAGYLGAALASPFVEVSPRRTWLSGAGMLAGNLIGMGSYMMAEPDDLTRRPLWASVGGLGLGVGTFLAYPHLRLGDQAAAMSLVGAAYGAGTWGLAMATSKDGSTPRLQGGVLALGTAGGIAGLLASGSFYPGVGDYPVTLASAALGATAGIGVGKLGTDATGTGELVGSLAGSAVGLAAGAAFSHYAQLRAPDLGAGFLGAGYGTLVGALAPSLLDADWGGWQRNNQGGLLLGLPAGAFAGAALSHLTNASGTSVGVASVGSALGLGMGFGTGLLWPESYSQPARIGAVAGVSAGLAATLLLEHPLRLHEGLGDAAVGLGTVGAGIGIAEGILLAGLVDPSGQVSQLSSRQIEGGVLLGGSAGLASGLVLSKYFTPGPRDLAVTVGGTVSGGLFGRGLMMTATANDGRGDTAGTMAFALAGATAFALVEHRSPLTNIDFAAGAAGMAYGGLVGALAPTLADAEWGGWRRSTEGGLLLGLGGGAMAAAALSHVTGPSPATLAVSSTGGLLGLGMGVGTGLLWPESYSQPSRIGAVAGVSAGLAASLLLEHPLRLHEGLGDAAPGMAAVGAGIGIAEGLLLAGLVDPSGEVAQTSSRQRAGGVLLGGSAGLASGLVLSKYFTPGPRNLAVTVGGGVLGGLFGRGLAMTASSSEGRGDAAGTMAGTLAGATAFALVEHRSPLTDIDFVASAAGLAYGGLVGALAPTLADAEWGGWWRNTEGGLLLGLGGGAMAAAALSHLSEPSPATLAVSSVGSLLGLGMGAGTGLLGPESYSQPSRIGAVAGVSAGLAASLLLEHPLHLDEELGENAAGIGAVSTGIGIAEGILLAGLVDPSGEVSQTSNRQLAGGALLGGSAGLASGLVLSKYFKPAPQDLTLTVGGTALGGLFGRGLMMTASSSEGRGDTAGTMAGAFLGATGFALTEHVSPLTTIDMGAGAAGLAYGGLVGALAPTLADAEWGGWRRSTEGGLLLGVGGGAMAAAALSHVAGTTPEGIAVGSLGGLLGLGMGVGTGLLWPENYSQPARIGAVSGVSAGMVGALLLEHPLRLHEGLGESAAGLGTFGLGLGIAEGILLAALVDPTGEVSRTSSRQLAGGALLGGSAGLASGFVLSKYFKPTASDLTVTVGGSILGGLFGRGLVMTATESDGRSDTAGTMAGALAGTAGFALVEHFSPLTEIDAAAAAVGMGYGGLVGSLASTLADASWGGWRRSTEGGLMLGVGGGAMAAAGLAHATATSGRTLGFGAAGALDGALTGVGIGILADQDPASTQGARIGAVAGTAGGLLLGLGLWPHLDFNGANLIFFSAASAVGGWTGAWSQVLGHGSLDDVDSTKVGGGFLAGAGGASILATALLPALHVDADLVGDALAADAIFSGAGAGMGALASRRADGPVWGMLGAGTAGLVLGGTLHDAIDFERSSGLLTFGALEGLWAGAWLPYVLRPSSEVTDMDHVAGVAAGGLGGLGLSLLASSAGTPGGKRLGMAGVGSAIGASLAGGSVLLSENLHDQRGVGIMLGGTAAGLGLGALVSPWVPLDGSRGLHMLGGASFGLAEGLAFGWAGRATTSSEYAGSALIGAGLGATLGLASSADASGLNMQQALVASGFSAWGGWVGSFAGAFANRDPHEVVLGGLAAANLGFFAGYGALRYDLVEPRDFGWLSLAGALGTALGGGAGAVFSTASDPRPVLAGLALGPVVGIGTGALIVPHLRHKAETSSSFFRAPKVAGARFKLLSDSEGKQRNSADVLAERKPSRILAGLKLAQRNLFDVTNWTPVFGSLPPLPGDPNPAPFFMGVSGGLR
jgi:hypothetical protein